MKRQKKQANQNNVGAAKTPVQTIQAPVLNQPEKNNSASSEEKILDYMIKNGKLSVDQENLLLDVAIQVEKERLENEKNGIQNKGSYAESFIDKIKDDKNFSTTQKDLMLNAGIKAEKMEKLSQLRGFSSKETPKPKQTGISTQMVIKNLKTKEFS